MEDAQIIVKENTGQTKEFTCKVAARGRQKPPTMLPKADEAKEIEVLRTDQRLVKSGIPGLDIALNGGLPEKHIVLITGPPGCGKTTFALQFITEGARKFQDKGLYISFEQPKDEILEQFLQFGWDLSKLEEEGKIKIVSFAGTTQHISQVWNEIEQEINAFEPRRLVIDSVDALSIHLDLMSSLEILELLGMNSREAGFMPTGDAVKRRTLIEIFRRLKEFRLVTLLVSEKPESGDTLSRDGIAEFICDGVLTMNYSPEKEDSFATLQIRKMRGMKHRREEFRTNLKSDGIWVEVDDKRLQ